MSDELQGQNVESTTAEGELQSQMPGDDKPTETEGLPEDVSERTRKEFEKLKEHNRQLAEELKKRERPQGSVLDSLKPSLPDASGYAHLNPVKVEEITNGLVDENGYVNTALLEKTLREANERALRAEQEAKSARETAEKFEESAQVRRAHKKYPELDPYSDKFDKDFFDLVRDKLVGQMMSGKKDLMQAAKDAKRIYRGNTEKQDKAKQKAKEAEVKQTQKEQINATSRVRVSAPVLDTSDLAVRTRQGDSSALQERLKQAGY